jgi:hypothetical protein
MAVARLDRAMRSAANDLTLIAEDTLLPLYKEEGRIKSRKMNLHLFPWPRTELEQMGEMEVELRVTLSYFVEPNPDERGCLSSPWCKSWSVEHLVFGIHRDSL